MRRNIVLMFVFLLLAILVEELQRQHIIALGAPAKGQSWAVLLAIVLAILAGYQLVIIIIHLEVTRRRAVPGEVGMLSGLVRFGAAVAVIILVLIWSGSLSAVGTIFGAFAGMLIGWSLQAPVSGMAAWVLINVKRPFRVGDRIMLPSLGLNGDVMDVGLMYTALNQVGGSIGSEEASGRHILIPNAMLFTQVVINYTPRMGADEAAHFLDEVIVRITFDSDWEAAEKILLDAARDITGKIVEETGQEPYIRSDFYDYGVYMRLRYMTMATDRPRITHELTKRIFLALQRDLRVDLAIPYVYSYRHILPPERFRYPDRQGEVQEVDIGDIDDPWEPGTLPEAEEEAIRDLARHIEALGLLQPLVLERSTNGRYRIVAGANRLRACKRLGWRRVPATIRDAGTPQA